MKRDAYVIAGALTLVVVAFVVAMTLYKKSNTDPQPVSQAKTSSRVSADVLIKDWSPSLGPTMARVVVVEFLDPECESCRAMHPIVKKTLKQYEGRIRYVLRYMPYHANSELAARWLEAAREQNLYWESLDAMFERQPEWGSHHAPRPELIPEILKSVGVDVKKAGIAKENVKFGEWIAQDKADGVLAGVNGTPTFFVNGVMLRELDETSLVALIESALGEP